jgi:hypothetical protein
MEESEETKFLLIEEDGAYSKSFSVLTCHFPHSIMNRQLCKIVRMNYLKMK